LALSGHSEWNAKCSLSAVKRSLTSYFARPLAREPAVKVAVDTSRDNMTTKPILLWPRRRSDIALHLDRDADDFLVVDTNYPYELQKLYKLRRENPIFDPYPGYGEHYRDFSDHIVASNCRYHIVGLKACQELLKP
jgi:hypothetical protein